MAENNLERLYEEISSYPEVDLKKCIEDRLMASLESYIYDIDEACSRIRESKPEKIFRGLSK